MRPPTCAICKKDFRGNIKSGGRVYFALTEKEKERKAEMKEKGMVGHPPGLEWFCGDHIEIAKRFSRWNRVEALRTIKAGHEYPPPRLRLANLDDAAAIQSLIKESLLGLSLEHYTKDQIRGALMGAFGLDTQLIEDQTYYVIEDQDKVIACGGWSYRRTLFGNDKEGKRDATISDPKTDPAKIRAFFVDPNYARKGLASQILEASEKAATKAGYSIFELMATLPGVPFYSEKGYVGHEAIEYELEDQLTITFVPMDKKLELRGEV